MGTMQLSQPRECVVPIIPQEVRSMFTEAQDQKLNLVPIERVSRAYELANDPVRKLQLFPIFLKSFQTEFLTDKETSLVDLTLCESERNTNSAGNETNEA